MNLLKTNISQLCFLLFFSIVFIFGSLLLENYIFALNQNKSAFPLLVYSENPEDIEKIIQIAKEQDAYESHIIVSPDSLRKSLMERYNLDEIDEIAQDFVLPSQIVITVKPVKMDLLMLLVLEIGENFPDNIIQYNDDTWSEIDVNVIRLRKIAVLLQVILLCIYLFIQIFLRITYIFRNKKLINAIVSSGLSYTSIQWKNFVNNIIYLCLALLLILLINITINYLSLTDYFITNYLTHYMFVNIHIILMLFGANLVLVMIQKPLLKRNRNE